MTSLEVAMVIGLVAQAIALFWATLRNHDLEAQIKRKDRDAARSAKIAAAAMKFRMNPDKENFAELRRSVALNILAASLILFTAVSSSAAETRHAFLPLTASTLTQVRGHVGGIGGGVNFDQCGVDGDTQSCHLLGLKEARPYVSKNAASSHDFGNRGEAVMPLTLGDRNRETQRHNKPVQFRPLVNSFPAAKAGSPSEGRKRAMSPEDGGGRENSFIDRISQIESRGDCTAIGDKGKARGSWQLTEAAWEDVDALRAKQGLPTFFWEQAHCDEIAREYALQYICLLSDKLTSALRRAPSEAELYSAYAHGFHGFQRRGFSLNKCAKHVRVKASQIGK